MRCSKILKLFRNLLHFGGLRSDNNQDRRTVVSHSDGTGCYCSLFGLLTGLGKMPFNYYA